MNTYILSPINSHNGILNFNNRKCITKYLDINMLMDLVFV